MPQPLSHSLTPSFLGAVDASGAGIGGAWLPTPTTPTCSPIIFRLPFPLHIQQRLVSAENPTGSITNSDLELAAIVTGAAILRHTHPTTHATLLCASDNQAAVTWQKIKEAPLPLPPGLSFFVGWPPSTDVISLTLIPFLLQVPLTLWPMFALAIFTSLIRNSPNSSHAAFPFQVAGNLSAQQEKLPRT